MNHIWIMVAFACYLGIMMLIGLISYKKTKNTEDYFLGGRNLGGWVAALSAQASDMSGWLLMGLPGSIYAFGAGQIWMAAGLVIGTVLNWILVASRLRRYTMKAGNSLTLPQFFENRFGRHGKILRVASSLFITIFFLIYTASGFASGATLFSTIFDLNYTVALAIGVLVILVYTFLGGFLAVCWTDFVQGFMMLITLIVVPSIAIGMMGGVGETSHILNSLGTHFLNPGYSGGEPISVINIISQLAWGLGYFGMPHILIRFMAIKNEREVRKSRVIAMVWVIISISIACLVGAIGYAFFANSPINNNESVFITMIYEIFSNRLAFPLIGGILLCGILAAIMSTSDSQLLVTASSISEDIYKGIIRKNASEKSMMWVSRISVVVISVLAFLIARNPENSVMNLVSNAWAGFGAAFGPVVLLSLFWRRSNFAGAASSMISGGLTVILWDYIPVGPAGTLGAITGLYSLIPGFCISLLLMIAISFVTKKPDKKITDVFDAVVAFKHLDDLVAEHAIKTDE
ncbi:MAG: sodium/proline symporter PutP [Clostridiales bacterium]|jgi:sodium/proline symporter|nr:sodium/proline symporter PutP [Clostridiales bacterium]